MNKDCLKEKEIIKQKIKELMYALKLYPTEDLELFRNSITIELAIRKNLLGENQ